MPTMDVAAAVRLGAAVLAVGAAVGPAAGAFSELAPPPFDEDAFVAPGGPGHPSSARPAAVMMMPEGCGSGACTALAQFWGQVGTVPRFRGRVFRAVCPAQGGPPSCAQAVSAGLLGSDAPLFTFWDGRGWQPYTGKRDIEALGQAAMLVLDGTAAGGGGGGPDGPGPPAADDEDDAARRVCMEQAFRQPPRAGTNVSGPDWAAAALRPADIPPVPIFTSYSENVTVDLPGVDGQPVSRGEVVWPSGMDLVSRLDVLPGLVRADEVERIRALVMGTPLTFDSDPDSVDGMASHEMFVTTPDLRAGGDPGSLKLDADPAQLAARRPLREALQEIMRPILAERITPFVQDRYAAVCNRGDGRACIPCYSLIRRYREGERRSHALHYDQHAIVTVVVSLADYGGEYTGGLYVSTGRAGRQVLPLSRGDAVVHGPDLLHGVGVEGGERWSWILWFRDSATCDDHADEWFTECAAAGNPVCEQHYANAGVSTLKGKLEWNERAAGHGLSLSMIKLARAHLKRLPSPLPYNPAEAARWFTKGVEVWDEPDCHYGLAQMLLANQTAPAHGADRVAAAIGHLEAAARGGHPYAAYNLGVAHLLGHGLPTADPAAAAGWFGATGLPEGFDMVAISHEAAGRPEEAAGWAARARRLGSGSAWRKTSLERTGSGGAAGVSLHSAWPKGPCAALRSGRKAKKKKTKAKKKKKRGGRGGEEEL